MFTCNLALKCSWSHEFDRFCIFNLHYHSCTFPFLSQQLFKESKDHCAVQHAPELDPVVGRCKLHYFLQPEDGTMRFLQTGRSPLRNNSHLLWAPSSHLREDKNNIGYRNNVRFGPSWFRIISYKIEILCHLACPKCASKIRTEPPYPTR